MIFRLFAPFLKQTRFIVFFLNASFLMTVNLTIQTISAHEMNNHKYIIVAALAKEMEGSNIADFAPIVYTGVGKVNAAIKLYEAIEKYKPDLVINFGTAGTLKNTKGIFHIDTFIQTDMDVRALGLARGVTPFSNDQSLVAKGVTLGTSDTFIVDPKKQLEGLTIDIDLVDMEAFALREVCKHLKVKFQSYKYVSDSANEEASDDWHNNANNGATAFIKILTDQYGTSTLIKSQ